MVVTWSPLIQSRVPPLAARCRTLLPVWDAWCADDGRVAAGLHWVDRAVTEDVPDLILRDRRAEVMGSMHIACMAGKVKGDPADHAWCVATAVYNLLWALTAAEGGQEEAQELDGADRLLARVEAAL